MKFFLFLTGMLIPASMVVLGYVLKNHSPKEINGLCGYRTERSMKNKRTWKFANTYCGELWLKIGTVITIISSVILFLLMNTTAFEIILLAIVLIQVIIMIVPIYFVEKALKENFDEHGMKK